MKKRVLAMLLAMAICLGIISAVLPVALAFTDISDPDVAEAAEVLRLLGVVDGVGGGSFAPYRNLDRASFCKMALEVAGRGKEALTQKNRVVFPDVTAKHWALGYVNAAASGQTPLIRGKGDGNFYPDDKITYGEAVTILMRLLGYGDSDVGSGAAWYSGYLAAAQELGLTSGLDLKGTDLITRGQAAILFAQLLYTPLKGSAAPYITQLGGMITEPAVILSTDAVAADGTTGSVLTSLGVYKTDRTDWAGGVEGLRGRLVLDKAGKLLAIQTDPNDTFRRFSLLSCNADHVMAAGGERLPVSLSTTVWKDGEAKTYETVWVGLRAGSRLVACFNGSGKLDYLYVGSAAGNTQALVVTSAYLTSNPFTVLTGGRSDFAMYKNGLPATLADLRQYDVGTYDKAANAVYVSDLRLTGIYEGVYPNTAAPSTVTVMGAEFALTPAAADELKTMSLGSTITLLLTDDLRVAGVLRGGTAQTTAVGIARMSGTDATVTLLGGKITLTGKTSYTSAEAEALNGRLVTVSSSTKGYLNLSPVSGGQPGGALNVKTGTVGGSKLAPNVKIYEQVKGSALTEITLDDLTAAAIPAEKIVFLSYDYAGRVNFLVLEDVTGDRYVYGYFVYEAGTAPQNPGDFNDVGANDKLGIRRADPSGNEIISSLVECRVQPVNGLAGGMILTADGRLAKHFQLSKQEGLSRSSFDLASHTVATTGVVYPIWKDVQCYNAATGRWYAPGYDGLGAALAFSDNITIYFDRAPEEGGKVRLVEVR